MTGKALFCPVRAVERTFISSPIWSRVGLVCPNWSLSVDPELIPKLRQLGLSKITFILSLAKLVQNEVITLELAEKIEKQYLEGI